VEPVFMQMIKAILVLVCFAAQARAATTVTGFHYDNQRSGWNAAETLLTPESVSGGGFGLLLQVGLDEQVDAQPLYVAGQTIGSQGVHDVVYVATENNSVYAIDAKSGAVLLSVNLGHAVPNTKLPGNCNQNSDRVGINSTPVIDVSAGLIYVMAYDLEHDQPVFRLHALSLSTLADTVASVVVTASAPLGNGKLFHFQAGAQRQRAALLETSGAVYAGFASFCDLDAGASRGWVLGWRTGSLQPLAATELVDRRPKDADSVFLSSVWMSGDGIASDDAGSLFFTTGNSDPDGKTYSKTLNLAESAVRLSADLTTVQSYYTPSNHADLDAADDDFGSGGMVLLPTQAGQYPDLAVAAGKADYLYLLDRDNLGGLGGKGAVLGAYSNNGCWCGPSAYVGPDGVSRVVASTGRNITVYRLVTSGKPRLVVESTGPALPSGGDPGFFTSVSSNGVASSTAVIWALPRPANDDEHHIVTLTAFDPANGAAEIFSAPAGSWPNAPSSNADLVPVVADGQVFVASYKSLAIFGLVNGGNVARLKLPAASPPDATTLHQLTGTALGLRANVLTIRTRDGKVARIDIAGARAGSMVAEPSPGHGVLARGDVYDSTGALVAKVVLHAKDSAALWAPDR
jgi:hypothetical protein